jgi:hypothetical protein
MKPKTRTGQPQNPYLTTGQRPVGDAIEDVNRLRLAHGQASSQQLGLHMAWWSTTTARVA